MLLIATTAAANNLPPSLEPGAELFEAGKSSEALAFFTSADRGSGGAWCDYFLGRLHLDEGHVDEALERLQAATEADPQSSLFVLWLGEAYVQKIEQVGMLKKLGVAKKARTSFERAVELAPQDLEVRRALVGYYLNAPAVAGGSRDKAMDQAREMMKIDAAKGHRLAGRIHVEEEDWPVAVREYSSAIAAGDKSSSAYYWLGFALQQSEEWEAAFAAFESSIEADASQLDSYYQLARTAVFSRSNLERAVECLSFYLQQPGQRGAPAAEHAHWRLGMVYELQDKDDWAAAEYRKALALDPKHEEARKALKALGST